MIRFDEIDIFIRQNNSQLEITISKLTLIINFYTLLHRSKCTPRKFTAQVEICASRLTVEIIDAWASRAASTRQIPKYEYDYDQEYMNMNMSVRMQRWWRFRHNAVQSRCRSEYDELRRRTQRDGKLAVTFSTERNNDTIPNDA